MVSPRSTRRRAVRSAILALIMTVATSYSAADGATGTTDPSEIADSAARPVDIIDDIVRGVRGVPRTPQLPRTTAKELARIHAQRAAAVAKVIEVGEMQKQLENHADAILREIGCDLAWPLLLPAEESDVESVTSGLGSDKWVYAYGDKIKETTAGAIRAAAFRELSGAFGGRFRNAMDWAQYGNDVREKATDLFGTDEQFAADLQQLVQINGAWYTRAFVYYARTCLKPPT